MKKHYEKFGYRKTENDLSPKAYALLNKMYELILKSGLTIGEIRLACSMLRSRVEKAVSESVVGGEEE